MIVVGTDEILLLIQGGQNWKDLGAELLSLGLFSVVFGVSFLESLCSVELSSLEGTSVPSPSLAFPFLGLLRTKAM